MNIWEAMQAAKCRRPHWLYWLQPNHENFVFKREDFFAQDWEIFEQKVEITHAQCQSIFNLGMKHASYSDLNNESYRQYQELLKELGFENG